MHEGGFWLGWVCGSVAKGEKMVAMAKWRCWLRWCAVGLATVMMAFGGEG